MLGFFENEAKVSCPARILLQNKASPIPELPGLHCAAYFGLEFDVFFLLDRDCDVEAADTLGRSALSWAADEGLAGIVQVLCIMRLSGIEMILMYRHQFHGR